MNSTNASGSLMAKALIELFATLRPKRLIETGTYDGRGSTTLIWKALQESRLDDSSTLITIECNPEHYSKACDYFVRQRMLKCVRPWIGHSIKRRAYPTVEEIRRDFVGNEQPGIYYDHDPGSRAELYRGECHFEGADNLLEAALAEFDWYPDFVFLDSAGHIGWKEFEILDTNANAPYHLMLDDVHHCKHARTLNHIKGEPSWTLLAEVDERFGWALARKEKV